MQVNLMENEIVINKTVNKNVNKSIKIKENISKSLKRIIDIVGGVVGCILLIPITIILWIVKVIIKDNEGNLFYTQKRIGKNGKEFKIYKFRTMVINADEKLEKYLQENEQIREEYNKYKKLKNDPRITKVGKFLRKTSIDEFPQFINVLKGEMSLVGPRPYLKREKKEMEENYNTIISIKPGITGYWQVNGRSDKDFKERIQMDITYIWNRNLWLDLKIILKTFFKIFKKEGAV